MISIRHGAQLEFDDGDGATPTSISHNCEEIRNGERIEQRYNYLRYEFDVAGKFYWARAYLDDIKTVSVFGPFESREVIGIPTAEIDAAIIGYFKRRYQTVLGLGSQGYKTIWQAD